MKHTVHTKFNSCIQDENILPNRSKYILLIAIQYLNLKKLKNKAVLIL